MRDAEVEPPKVRIFLSHAKADGAEEARGLRDYIYQQTQLSAFFDENDIALGGQFADVLDSTIRTGTAALIAVQSDVYAHRPWCRREIQLFREPRTLWNAWHGGPVRARRGPAPVQETIDGESARRAEMRKQAGIWVLDPLIVVEAMKGKSIGRSIPELGNAPAIR